MKSGTQLLVFGALVATAAATLWLASQGAATNVRTVEELEADPAGHRTGSYVLMAVPEPATIPFTGPSGVRNEPNPAAPTELSWTRFWGAGASERSSTYTLSLRDEGDHVVWRIQNDTRTNPSGPILESLNATGSFAWAGQAFAVRGFDDGDSTTPMLWALLPKAPTEALQPKPSQFTGRLMSMLPDGTPLPDGVLVYQVDTFTVGCSSKFLPPEEQARMEAADTTVDAAAPA